MIDINNNIDKEVKVDIYVNNVLVGTCENELAFLDIRRQIKTQKIKNAEFEFNGIRYKIDTKGELSEYPTGLWESHTRLLCELIED